MAPGGGTLDLVIVDERSRYCAGTSDAIGRAVCGVLFCQFELDTGISRQRCKDTRKAGNIWISLTEILVQDFNLAINLGIRDILRWNVVDNMYNDRDYRHARPLECTASPRILKRMIITACTVGNIFLA